MRALIPYNEFLFESLQDFMDALSTRELRCYASDFIPDFDMDVLLFDEAVERAIRSCRSQGIPPYIHFKKIYRYSGDALEADWKLSPLGCYLILINADPSNPLIARFQTSLIIKD
ncbi:MAG: hypothetical protein R6T99_06010 [Bacteroidales bacterium]